MQIPVFIALYWVLLSAVELRHAPWIGWIHDLSAPDPYFVLPVIYAITAYLQVKLSPTPITDPVQAKVMQIMPIAFSVHVHLLPVGPRAVLARQQLAADRQQWHMNRVLEKRSGARGGEAALTARFAAAARRRRHGTSRWRSHRAMTAHRPTIAAIATPPGRGGVGIVRVSGANLDALIAGVVGAVARAARGHASRRFATRAGAPLDQGLALYFPAPHSYTGETVLELHGHGGPAVLRLLLARCVELGARLAEPGEFTKRAFLNGKLDLAQAESVADLIDAATATAARAAARSLTGAFSREVHALVDALIELRMFTEATLDFPDEDIEFLRAGDAARQARRDCARALARCSRARAAGALLRDGLTVVLIGRPNVGKSSLLNRLARDDVAIVTPIAGTTRDTVERQIEIARHPAARSSTPRACATPPTRSSASASSARGRRSRAPISRCCSSTRARAATRSTPTDRAILARLPAGAAAHRRPQQDRSRRIAPRVERATTAACAPHVWLSALDRRRRRPARARGCCALAGVESATEDTFLARERHVAALRDAAAHLDRGGRRISRATPPPLELFAEELREAQQRAGGDHRRIHRRRSARRDLLRVSASASERTPRRSSRSCRQIGQADCGRCGTAVPANDVASVTIRRPACAQRFGASTFSFARREPAFDESTSNRSSRSPRLSERRLMFAIRASSAGCAKSPR